MHLCTISVDRYLSLRYPMKFGRLKTRRRVVLKLVLVWCLSIATSMPLSLMYAADTRSTIVDGVCQIPVSLFQIIGSLFSFYIPLIIMLVTYALTVRLLSQKESELLASGGVDTPITPLSHSVRLKRLLCKTTSTLSSTTATSIADTELSETAPSEENESESNNSPNKRPLYLRYSSQYRSTGQKHGRNYAIREKNTSLEVPSQRLSYDSHLRPPTSSSAVELSVYPKYNKDNKPGSPNSLAGTPKRKYKSLTSNGTKSACRSRRNSSEGNKIVEIRINESDSPENTLQEDGDSEGINGTSVTIPCACAPRFFLEGIARNNPSNDGCGDCSSHYEGINSQGFLKEGSEEDGGRKRTFIRSLLSKMVICQNGRGTNQTGLESPWHDDRRPSPCPSETIMRPNLRSTLFHRPRAETTVASISPASKLARGGPPSSSSSRSTWRTRSCTASLRLVSSKRHGRNLRMEQKATKVLGIVFFTFVVLWAPFFIINILLGACPSCINHISDDVINFVTWLGYVSSTVNPFFYTFFNKSFREAFVKILKCNIRSRRKYNF